MFSLSFTATVKLLKSTFNGKLRHFISTLYAITRTPPHVTLHTPNWPKTYEVRNRFVTFSNVFEIHFLFEDLLWKKLNWKSVNKNTVSDQALHASACAIQQYCRGRSIYHLFCIFLVLCMFWKCSKYGQFYHVFLPFLSWALCLVQQNIV